MKLLKDKTFIIFGEDYNRHPHSLEHLLRPLFKQNTFLWVETIGLRTPSLNLYDLKRIVSKLKGWLTKSKDKAVLSVDNENVTVINPFMIPFNKISFIRSFNKWNVKRVVQRTLNEKNKKDPILVTSVPNSCDFIGEFQEILSVYYCVDEFSLWPGLDYEFVKQLEAKLLERVNFTICTSEALSKSKTKTRVPTPVITHGVEVEHFSLPYKKINTKSPNICYFGLFDQRSDLTILKKIAQSIPKAQIKIIGEKIVATPELDKLDNIDFIGKVPYSSLPKEIEDTDFFILPYKINELTNNINPLKLKEYLATGRPVISTPLPEVKKLSSYLYISNTGESFVETICNLDKFDSEFVCDYIQKNETWLSKCDQFSKLINSNLKD